MLRGITWRDVAIWYEKASDVDRDAFRRSLLEEHLPEFIPPGTERPWWFELDGERWSFLSDRFRETYELRLSLMFWWYAKSLDEDIESLDCEALRVLVKAATRSIPALSRRQAPADESRSDSDRSNRKGRRSHEVSLSTQVEITFMLAQKWQAGLPRSLSRAELLDLANRTGHHVETLRKPIVPELASALTDVLCWVKAQRNIEFFRMINRSLIDPKHYAVKQPTPRQLSYVQTVVPMLQNA